MLALRSAARPIGSRLIARGPTNPTCRFVGPLVQPRARALATAASGSAADEKQKGVVLSKRLPHDFVENTLLPHIEAQLLENIQAYTPAELAKIARAYSKQNVRQYALCKKLAETIVYRISAFDAVDIIDVLGAMWTLIPGDEDLFEALEERILLKLEDFTVLNLIGIVRIFNKRATKHNALMLKVMPKIRELLQEYEAMELSEMLMSIAQSREASRDMDILMVLVPEIEKRYSELSLVHAINNVWALTQLQVVHERFLDRLAQDLRDTRKTHDLPPNIMSRIVWIYKRCNAWDKVSDAMLPLVKACATEFRCKEFARLAQALPGEAQLLQTIASALVAGIDELGRKDFLLFFLGCVHGELFEEGAAIAKEPTSMVARCLAYVRDEQDNFKRDEVQKLVYLLHFSPKYKALLDELPASWAATKEETQDFIRAKGQ